MAKKHLGLALAFILPAIGLTGFSGMEEVHAAEQSQILSGEVETAAAGTVQYNLYLPPGYDESEKYPSLYLLHGRGDTMAAWPRVADLLDQMITGGEIDPLIVVMPDAPWNDRGSWYTDSLYTGTASSGPGVAVATAIGQELVEHIDASYSTAPNREARAIGGYSMGGAGALQFVLQSPQTFSAGIILSPAVYSPVPPADSSTRNYGAYGRGDALFDKDRYRELHYQTAFESFDPTLPVHLFIAAGDDEWANPVPAESHNDIDYESATLYNQARRVLGITAELRIMDGGHDWSVWEPGFVEAIKNISPRLKTEESPKWEADLYGTAGDDRAGGVVATDQGVVLALNMAQGVFGGMDVEILSRDNVGNEIWRTSIATAANDRVYGLAQTDDSNLITVGYTRGNVTTGEAKSHDTAMVASLTTEGSRNWVKEFGQANKATRFYAVSPDGQGGVYAAGYTNGSFEGAANAGDKDAVLVRIDSAGNLLWSQQIGGPGEDKALAVTAVGDGVVVGGSTSDIIPEIDQAEPYGAWYAKFDQSGQAVWTRAVASAYREQVNSLTTDGSGNILLVGQTKGAVSGSNLGDNDIFVLSVAPDGNTRWATQLGTASDDRGVVGISLGTGTEISHRVIATTYGKMGTPIGEVDLVSIILDDSGQVETVSQFGSTERDGSDEWDEGNGYLGAGASGVWLTGLTYGRPFGTVSFGSGDIFLQRIGNADGAGEPEVPEQTNPSEVPNTTNPENGGADPDRGAIPPFASGIDGGNSGLALTGFSRVLLFIAVVILVSGIGIRNLRSKQL